VVGFDKYTYSSRSRPKKPIWYDKAKGKRKLLLFKVDWEDFKTMVAKANWLACLDWDQL
jgi:hypothetical protein